MSALLLQLLSFFSLFVTLLRRVHSFLRRILCVSAQNIASFHFVGVFQFGRHAKCHSVSVCSITINVLIRSPTAQSIYLRKNPIHAKPFYVSVCSLYKVGVFILYLFFVFFLSFFFRFFFCVSFVYPRFFCAHFNSHNLWIYFILFLPVFERNKHNTIKIMKPTTKNTTNKQDTHTHRRQKYSFYTCEQLDENGMAKTKPTKE